MTNTILTASAQDHQADHVMKSKDQGFLASLSDDDLEFAMAISPVFTRTEHLGYFV